MFCSSSRPFQATIVAHSVKIPGLDNKQSFLKFSFSASISALVVSLLHVVALGFPAPAKCQIGLILESSRMNIFEELKPRIDVFKATREHVVDSALLPSIDRGVCLANLLSRSMTEPITTQ